MKKRTLSLLLAVICLFALTAGMLSGCVGTKLQVSFDLNYEGAPEAPTAIKVKAGKTYGKLPAVTVQREGYTFVGWCLDADGEELVTSETKVTMKSDHTLYAKWEGLEYTVSYDLQGGNINGVTTVESTTVKVGNVYSMMAIPDDPEKDNHTFLGWYYDAEGTQGPVTASTKVVKTCDHTLYAKWKENQLLYDFEQIEDISAFNNRGNGLSFNAVAYGESNQLMIQNPNEGKSDNFLVMWAELKAGTRVTMDVTFTGELTKGARMHLFCYGANIVGDPITTGVINKTLSDTHRKWYDGNGYRAKQENGAWFYGDENDWHKGNTVTIDFVVMEDCSGLTLWVNLGSNMEPAQWAKNAIYIDNIQFTPGYQEITDADKGGVEQKPQEETQGEENFPFTFECGSVDSDVFKLRDSNLNMSVVKRGGSQQLKLQLSTANGKNWLWLNKPLKAGTKATFDVTFDNAGTGASMSIFGYGSQTNGDPISVKPAGSNINIQWYHGQGVRANSGKHTVEINVYEACSGISLMLGFDGNPETVIYLDNFRLGKMSEDQVQTSGETNFPFTFECGSVDSDIFKLRDSDLKMSVKSFDNSKQLVIQPTKTGGNYWLWLNKNLKAGHKVTFDVTFDRGNTNADMHVYAYGSKTNGDPITEGAPTDTIPQSWFWGQGVNADFSGGNTNKQTITITAYQPCSGVSLMLGMQSDTTIYIDNVTLDTSGEIEEEPSEPDEPDPPAADAETESPFTFDGGAFSADIFNNRNGGLSVSVENKQLKLQQPAGASNWLWIKQDMPAGTVVTMDVTFSGEGMNIFGYGSKENGDPITEGTATESVPQEWFWGQGGSENGSYTFTIYEDCYGLSLMLGFAGSTETAIYIDNVVITVPQVDVGVEETESPFTFDGGAFSADIFNNRNNGPTVSVENKQLKLQLPAGAPNWLWLKQEMKAGTVITMDVTFSGEGMNIFGYGSKENGDPITEGTATESVPQEWFWGQGGSENGSYTFTIYEDCYGLSLMLGFAGSTETAIYIDNVVITAPEPSTSYDVGVLQDSVHGAGDSGIYFTTAEANDAPWGDWNTYYDTANEDCLKLVRNGQIISVGLTGRNTICKFGANDYYLRLENHTIGEYAPFTTDDMFIVEGAYTHVNSGTTLNIAKTYIYHDGSAWVFSATEPAKGPETESPFTFDDGVFSADIFNNRNNGPTVSVENKQLKLQLPAGAPNWLWLKQEMKAGTVITMDVTFSGEGMNIFGYGSKENGDPITEGTATESVPQEWFWGQGGSENGSYTFTIYEDCYGLSLMLGFANSTETVIYIDNVVITKPQAEEPPEEIDPPATGDEAGFPFTFEDSTVSTDIFKLRDSDLEMTVAEQEGSQQLKLQPTATTGNYWLWLDKELTAGTVITVDVTFERKLGTMGVYLYGAKENGDPITEGTATDQIPQSWYDGQGASFATGDPTTQTVTFTVYEDCHGISFMLDFNKKKPNIIYLDNIQIAEQDDEEPTAETVSPFTFDDGVFSADIFNNRNNGPTVSVENKQLKLQLPAGAPNWLWIKQDMKAGTVITMDVTFSGAGMNIFGYGSKANGDPITEGTVSDSVPQSWFWGQGGDTSGSYTFTIYEDCCGLSLMLGFANSTETAIYLDNIVITEP